jgi:septum site-determining protein MinC
VAIQLPQRQSLNFRARSYMAFVLTPQLPVAEWLADLRASMARSSSGFFAGHAVVLDLSNAQLAPPAIVQLVASLAEYGIRVLGVEGIDPAIRDTGLPPVLRAGRNARESEPPAPAPAASAAAPHAQQPASLLMENPVRSGQSVVFLDGDVTVLGSVGSGAEIIAGGSIHIYGVLRGLAMAGATGNARARIFCHRFDGELLAVGQQYNTADEIAENLRRGPVQAWLDGNTLKISAMH